MSNKLKAAIEAAKVGGKRALKYYEKDLEIELKNDRTPVTIADRKSEEVIKSHILKSFPNAKFVGEESGGSTKEDEFWTIDPIDGTRSFSRGIPSWCVLIGYYKNSQFELGVCYYPIFNQTLYAQRNKGAYLNGKKVHVSKIDSLNKAFLGFGNPRYMEDKNSLLNLIDLAGSARSWEVTYSNFLLAQGKVDVVLDGYAYLWDVSPFKVIIEEAGGKITRINGDPITIHGKGYLSTNGLLHDEVVKIINNQ